MIQFFLPAFLCFVSLISWASPIDSLRMETINGKQFIIHQVDPKETLYSISRKYNVPVALIRDENPTVDAGLSVGQLVKVPYMRKSKPKAGSGSLVHQVTAKETLFSISKLYDVSVDDLKAWNNLKDNSLSVGQTLVVGKKATGELTKSQDVKPLPGVHVVTEKETLYSLSKIYGASVQQLRLWNNLTSDELKPGQTLFVLPPATILEKAQPNLTEPIKPSTPDIKISETVIGSDEIHEKGMAELLEGTEGSRKYLGQHKTAKVGTIMKVRNAATNKEVFVRVTGPLNESGGTIIKVSKSAFDQLGATDPKFTVELIYYK